MKNSTSPLVIVITGPTASGKTDLAMRLSDTLPVELINMDSAQVYRNMNIGTAKITKEERQKYPHHLMDIISPEDSYSVAQFVRDVNELIPQIIQRGNIPVLVGGTPLYYKALLDGLADLPSANEELRAELNTVIATQGHQVLKDELAKIDPQLASQIQGNDSQRLVRFVEIARLTGKAPSMLFALQNEKKSIQKYNFFHICFFPEDRQWLHNRIEKRFQIMLENGFIDEVIALREKYTLSLDNPSMRCAGYRQVWEYLEGKYDNLPKKKNGKPTNTALEELRDRGVFSTRQLAKRQLTWLRKLPADITIVNPEEIDFSYIQEKLKVLIN